MRLPVRVGALCPEPDALAFHQPGQAAAGEVALGQRAGGAVAVVPEPANPLAALGCLVSRADAGGADPLV